MATREKHRQRSAFSYRRNRGLLSTFARATYFHADEKKKRVGIKEYFKALFGKLTKRQKTA